jgi:hypothetical protein
MSSIEKTRISHLANELQRWVCGQVGPRSPSSNEFYDFISEYLKDAGLEINEDAADKKITKVAALFKSKPANSVKKVIKQSSNTKEEKY